MKLHRQDRKFAMIIDICPTDPRIDNLKAVKLVFLLPSNASKAQSVNQGLIRALKSHWLLNANSKAH